MVVLLDTHVLLWALDAPERLSQEVVAQIESPETTVYFSAASIWEVAIKMALGKLISIIRPRTSRRQRRIPALFNCPSAQHMAHRSPIFRCTTMTRSIVC